MNHCPACNSTALEPKTKEITRKQRVKFGLIWLVVSAVTAGIGLIVWLVWPRRTVVVSVDRYVHCSVCGVDSR